MNNEKKKNIRMNLTLDAEFYETIQHLAERDHLNVTTWTRQFLMKQVSDLLNFEELSSDSPF